MARFGKRIAKIIHLALNLDKANTVAVDATGFELESKSYYYRNVWNSHKKQKTRQYMKLSIAIDTEKQLIMKHKIRRKIRHDTINFKKLLNGLSAKRVIADKGYDSWENRKLVLNKLKAVPIIPVRNHTNFYGYFKHGRKIDGSIYHQRSKVETIFSVIKRKYGSVLRARSFVTQKVEIIGKLIAYNLDRKLRQILIFFGGCTRA